MYMFARVFLLAVAALAVAGQDIKDNPAPKAGDVCRDAGDQWRNITLGPCEAGTRCLAYKRGVWKCTPLDARGRLPIGAECYNEYLVDQKNKTAGAAWRKVYRERSCIFQGVDKQGTPTVQCIATAQDPKVYKCGTILPLGQPGCFTVAGSMIWGRWNDNQMYDACNGCPCTPPGKRCKTGPCKYPLCECTAPCDPARQAVRCATS